MSGLRRLLLPAILCAGVPACDDGGASIADAGHDAPGGVDATTTDAGSGDAAVDGAGPSATVTVTVYGWRNAQVAAGADVLFLDSSGAVATRTTTDAAGVATGPVPAGGQLLVVDNDGNLTSFVGLEDGDQLLVGSTTPVGTAVNGTVTVPALAGATRYHVMGRCATGISTTTTVTVGISSACAAGPRDLLVTASSATSVIGYLFAPAVAVAPATTVGVTGAWAAPGSFSASFAGVPPSVSLLRLSHVVYGGGVPLLSNLEALPAAPGGTTSGTYPHPVGVGDAGLVIYYANDASGGFRRRSTYAAPSTAANEPDLGAALLPPVAFTTPPVGASVAWTAAGGGGADGIVVTLDALEKGASRATWRWVLPGGATSVSLPELPADLVGVWNPIDGTDLDVTLVDSSSVTAGRMFRETVFTTARAETFGPMPVVVRTSSRSLP